MSVELLQLISLAAFVASAAFALVSIALFFLLDIPKLYNDISGRTAKKSIEEIRQQNKTTGNKAHQPSAVNMKRGKLTDEISSSGNLRSKGSNLPFHFKTEKFATATLAPDQENFQNQAANETTMLTQESNETTILNQAANETTILNHAVNETTILSQPSNETTVLRQDGDYQFMGDTGVLESDSIAYFALDFEMGFLGSDFLIQ